MGKGKKKGEALPSSTSPSTSLESIGLVVPRIGDEVQYYWIDPYELLETSSGDTLVMAKKSGGKDRRSGGTEGVEIFLCGRQLIASYRVPHVDKRIIGIVVHMEGYDKPFIVFKKETKHSRYFKDAQKLDPEAAYAILLELLETPPTSSSSLLDSASLLAVPCLEDAAEDEEDADHPKAPLISPPQSPLASPSTLSLLDKAEEALAPALSSSLDAFVGAASLSAPEPTKELPLSKTKAKRKKSKKKKVSLKEQCMSVADEALTKMIDDFLDEQLVLWVNHFQDQKKKASKSVHGKDLLQFRQVNKEIDNFIEVVKKQFNDLRGVPDPATKLSKSYGLLAVNNSPEALKHYKSSGDILPPQNVIPTSSLPGLYDNFGRELSSSSPIFFDRRPGKTAATASIPKMLPQEYHTEILSNEDGTFFTTRSLQLAWSASSGSPDTAGDPIFCEGKSYAYLSKRMKATTPDGIYKKLAHFVLSSTDVKIISGVVISVLEMGLIFQTNVQELLKQAVELAEKNVVIIPMYFADFEVWNLLELCKIENDMWGFYYNFKDPKITSLFNVDVSLESADKRMQRMVAMCSQWEVKFFTRLITNTHHEISKVAISIASVLQGTRKEAISVVNIAANSALSSAQSVITQDGTLPLYTKVTSTSMPGSIELIGKECEGLRLEERGIPAVPSDDPHNLTVNEFVRLIEETLSKVKQSLSSGVLCAFSENFTVYGKRVHLSIFPDEARAFRVIAINFPVEQAGALPDYVKLLSQNDGIRYLNQYMTDEPCKQLLYAGGRAAESWVPSQAVTSDDSSSLSFPSSSSSSSTSSDLVSSASSSASSSSWHNCRTQSLDNGPHSNKQGEKARNYSPKTYHQDKWTKTEEDVDGLLDELAMLRLTGSNDLSQEDLRADQKSKFESAKQKVKEMLNSMLGHKFEMPKVASKVVEVVSIDKDGKVAFTKTKITTFVDTEQDLIPCLPEPEVDSGSSSASVSMTKTPDNLLELDKPIDKSVSAPTEFIAIAAGSGGQIYPVLVGLNTSAAAIEEACS